MKKRTQRVKALAAALAMLLAVPALAPVQALADPAPLPGGAVVTILHDMIDREDFRQVWDFEPLVSVTDKNEDGIWELLAVYECQDGNDYYVCEEVWLIDGQTEQSSQVGTGVLFHEVGGNSGTVSLVDRDGQLGVLISSSEPDGSGFYDRYDYFSLAEGKTDLGSEYVTLDRTGTYGLEDDAAYTVDTEDVSRQEFEDTLDSMEPYFVVDILSGPDEDWNVVPFNIMLM